MLISKLPGRLSPATSMSEVECDGLPPFAMDTRPDKDGWLSSPARFLPQAASRTAENVLDVGWLVLDVDDAATDRTEAFLTQLLAGDLAVLVHSTHRYDPAKPKLRFWIPLSRPVMRVDWKRFWLRAVTFVGAMDIVDKACKDPGRWYYNPSQPPGGQGFVLPRPGLPLDVDALWARPEVQEPFTAELGTTALTKTAVTEWLGSGLRRSPKLEHLVAPWERVRDGEAWADEGQVHNTARDMTMALAMRLPNLSPGSVGAFFAPSCAITGDGTYTPELIAQLYESAVTKTQEAQHKQAAARLDQDRITIRIATGGRRETPYTQEEVAKWRHERPWILQKDTAYWALVDGHYKGPYSVREAQTALRSCLLPAESCGEVQLDKLTMQGGIVPRGLQDLADSYGKVVNTVRYSYLEETDYNPVDGTLVLKQAERATVEPVYHAGVEQWLMLLGGEPLKAWLTHLFRLDRALPALFMVGHKNVGKTALAVSLARLWKCPNYTTLEAALGKYNLSLLKNPIIFSDEGLPKDNGNRPRTQAFRRLVQESMRYVEAKFLPAVPLEGCTRVIVASNSLDVLYNDENLTTDDLAAISERILMLRPGPELEAFIKDVPFREWMDSGVVTAHLAWVIANAQPVPADVKEPRFLVESKDELVSQSLATGTSWGSSVCSWLVDFLENPDKLALRTDQVARRVTVRGPHKTALGTDVGRRFLACPQAIKVHWDVYGDQRLMASDRTIGRALATIAPKKTKLTLDDREVNVRVVDLGMLRTWCANVGRDVDLDAALERCETRLNKHKKDKMS